MIRSYQQRSNHLFIALEYKNYNGIDENMSCTPTKAAFHFRNERSKTCPACPDEKTSALKGFEQNSLRQGGQ